MLTTRREPFAVCSCHGGPRNDSTSGIAILEGTTTSKIVVAPIFEASTAVTCLVSRMEELKHVRTCDSSCEPFFLAMLYVAL